MPYFKDITKAGKTMEIHKYTIKKRGPKNKGKRQKPTPEQMEKVNQINAERKLTRIINANFREGDFHIVLTYKKAQRPSPAEAKKNMKKFLDNLRKRYKKMNVPLKYIQVTEHENKAIHHHLIVNDVNGQNITKLISQLWIWGRPRFTNLDKTGQYKDLAEYLIKETSKSVRKDKKSHKQCYSCSTNLKRPKPKTEIVKATRWMPDPKPIKGYYIDRDTVYNGIDPFTGREYQRYTMIQLDCKNKSRKEQRE